MVRKYVSKGQRARWTLESMKLAASAVLDRGVSLKQAAKNYMVPRTTLRRHLKKGGSIKKQLGRKTVLTETQEMELETLILDMEGQLYGLTLKDVRRLVYQYCEIRKIPHPFNQESQLAGKDWADSFMKRHPHISLRVPEPTSIARAIGFNRTKVDIFFKKYESLVFRDSRKVIPDTNIYNEDESGYSNVHEPSRILAKKGKRTVGTLTSAEKGKTITAVCCMSATGHFIPPLLVFPRVRMREELMDKAIPGAIGRANPSGWINADIFTDWFDHFLSQVQPKFRTEPTLLILDGHNTHTKNLEVIEKARENNVLLLSLPSHCTHKMQPLDRTFFKSLNSAYNTEVRLWLRNHPGRALSEKMVPELLHSAYSKAATIDIAANGFRKCGLVPYNPNIFTDEDFKAAEMSGFDPERPITEPENTQVDDSSTGAESDDRSTETTREPPTVATDATSVNVAVAGPSVDIDTAATVASGATSVGVAVAEPSMDVDTAAKRVNDKSDELSAEVSGVSSTDPEVFTPVASSSNIERSSDNPQLNVSFSDLLEKDVASPAPNINKRKRKVAHAEVLTSSPYKNELQASKSKQAVTSKGKAQVQSKGKGKAPARTTAKPKKSAQHPPNTKEWHCLVCKESWSQSQPGENWIKCSICFDWAHELCTSNEGLAELFICDYCDE